MNRRAVVTGGAVRRHPRRTAVRISSDYRSERGVVKSRGESSRLLLRCVRSCACLASQCGFGSNQPGSATVVAHAPRCLSLGSWQFRLKAVACGMEGKGARDVLGFGRT